ncbi:nuclear transport factor 2 family protein [Candidatus Peribacteria bacterium]|nr:nuclear transport factor 2 family protein [Candidatus Peribacteria bacterium]
MTLLQSITALYKLVQDGRDMEALDTYYADEVVITEGDGAVRHGKEAQRAAMEAFSAGVTTHDMRVLVLTANEQTGHTAVEVEWDATWGEAGRATMREVGVQQWQDGKIIAERFYYDTRNMS